MNMKWTLLAAGLALGFGPVAGAGESFGAAKVPLCAEWYLQLNADAFRKCESGKILDQMVLGSFASEKDDPVARMAMERWLDLKGITVFGFGDSMAFVFRFDNKGASLADQIRKAVEETGKAADSEDKFVAKDYKGTEIFTQEGDEAFYVACPGHGVLVASNNEKLVTDALDLRAGRAGKGAPAIAEAKPGDAVHAWVSGKIAKQADGFEDIVDLIAPSKGVRVTWRESGNRMRIDLFADAGTPRDAKLLAKALRILPDMLELGEIRREGEAAGMKAGEGKMAQAAEDGGGVKTEAEVLENGTTVHARYVLTGEAFFKVMGSE